MLIGAVAAVLLLVGGLDALQQATTLVALPFVVVMLGLAVALVRDLARDPAVNPPPRVRRSGSPPPCGPPGRTTRRTRHRYGATCAARAEPARAPRSPGCPPMPPAGRA